MVLKKGQKLTINGEKLVVASINDDGTATLNYASGSGKKGFRGKIVNPDTVKIATSPKAIFVDTIDPIDDLEYGSFVIEDYNKPDADSSVNSESNGERANQLILSGVDSKKVTDALTAYAGSVPPTEEQISSRLEFLESEKAFNDIIMKIRNKKFRWYWFSSEWKYDYYGDARDELNKGFEEVKRKTNLQGKDSAYYKPLFEKLSESHTYMVEFAEDEMQRAWDI